MSYARNRQLIITADGSANFTAPCTAKYGVNFSVEGIFSGTINAQRRGADGNWVNLLDDTETQIKFTAAGTYSLAPLPCSAEYRLNCPSGSFSQVADTSTSSNAVGTGAKTFTVGSSKTYVTGEAITVADTAAPTTNFMTGTVTSYSGTTLVINSLVATGSGTKTAWTITTQGQANLLVEGR